ncbi:MAG: hypothetical protein U0V74_15265 [Chitinophagales bacterium]
MKLSYVFALLLLVGFSACKQDFDITADYKEIPVVYGLLNDQENTHYIRIQKGYLIDGNAYNAAGNPDSIYYPDVLSVEISRLNNNGNVEAVYPLTRVDGNLIGLPKDPGTFSNAENILYTFNGSLNPDKTYRLDVTNTSNGNKFSAVTTMVKDFTVVTPFSGQYLNLHTVNPPKAVFYTAQNGGVYDLKIRFPYKEYRTSDNALLKDTFADIFVFKSKFVDDILGGNQVVEDINGSLILNTLHNVLTRDDQNIYRVFNLNKGMTFYYAAGGTDVSKYMAAQLAQGSGLASNEAVPPYTNVTGGYGIFSSRHFQQIDSVLLNADGLDTLACSPLAAGLRFKGSFGQICN